MYDFSVYFTSGLCMSQCLSGLRLTSYRTSSIFYNVMSQKKICTYQQPRGTELKWSQQSWDPSQKQWATSGGRSQAGGEQTTQIRSRRRQQKNWWERKRCRGVKFSLSPYSESLHPRPAAAAACAKVQISSLQSKLGEERQRGVGKIRNDDKKGGRRRR